MKTVRDLMKKAGYVNTWPAAQRDFLNKLVKNNIILADEVEIQVEQQKYGGRIVKQPYVTDEAYEKIKDMLDGSSARRLSFSKIASSATKKSEPAAEPAAKPTENFYTQALGVVNDLKQRIAGMEKEVAFARSVKVSEDCINVGMLARILFMNGIEMTEKKLFAWLREHGYIEDLDRFKNVPTEKALTCGYMKFAEAAVSTSSGTVHINFTPKITGKGQEFFINLFEGMEELPHD